MTDFHWANERGANGMPRPETLEADGWVRHVRHPNYPASWLMRKETTMGGSERFHAILDELGALHDRKQADYGRETDPFANVRASEEWGVPAWVGAMVRATDKVRRLQRFAQKGVLLNEGAADSLRDLAVYAVIALVLLEEQASVTVVSDTEVR